MQEKGGYIIDVKPVNKSVTMNVVGDFTAEQAEQFHLDYEKQVNSIAADEFVLNVDCTDMKVINKEMTPALTHSFNLYKSSGFKKIAFHITANAIVKMQLNRIAKSVGLPNYEIIQD